MALPNSPALEKVLQWSTPAQDIVFRIEKEFKQASSSGAKYGQTYQQCTGLNDPSFNDYILSYREPNPQRPKYETWWFVMPFEDQWKYNWEIAQVGVHRWPGITQTFIIPRDQFTGDDMEVHPPPELTRTWVRMRSRQNRSEQPWMDSLFVTFIVEWQDHADPIIEYKSDSKFGIPVQTTTTTVPSSNVPTGLDANQTYIGNQWSLLEQGSANTDALDAYMVTFPSTTNSLSIPDVLEGVDVTWSTANSDGEFDSEWDGIVVGTTKYELSGSESGTSDGSASVIPELVFNIRQYWGRNIPSTLHFFFMPIPVTASQILTRLGAFQWPVFQPKSHVIALKGSRIGVNARASANASVSYNGGGYSQNRSQGEGGGADVSVTNNTRAIPPTIHGLINFTGDTSKSISVSAVTSVGWTGTGTPVPLPSADATYTKTLNATGSVSPTSLAATTPASIPSTGIYLIRSSIEIWGYGYAMVMAETVDAADIA